MKNRSKFSWLELLSGLGMIALGVAAIAAPNTNLTYLYTAVVVVTGINAVVFYSVSGIDCIAMGLSKLGGKW